MLLGLAIEKDISLVDLSGKPCHFIEVPLKATNLLMSDARARGLGVSWRAGWSVLMADPTFIEELDPIALATLEVHAQKYHPLALTVYTGYLFDAPLPGDRLDTMNMIVSNAERLRKVLPVEVLLENAPIGPGNAPKWSLEPDFIWQTLVGSGCKMMLNIAHALINAQYLGRSPGAYLEELPLEAVEHIHISGVRNSPTRSGLYDARETLTERELDALAFVLRRTRAKAIVLDYSKEPAKVAEQMAAIREVAGLPARPTQE